MTAVYGGIDLHSNNSVVVVMDDSGKVVYRRRLVNDLPRIDEALAVARQDSVRGVLDTESNWANGLPETGSHQTASSVPLHRSAVARSCWRVCAA